MYLMMYLHTAIKNRYRTGSTSVKFALQKLNFKIKILEYDRRV